MICTWFAPEALLAFKIYSYRQKQIFNLTNILRRSIYSWAVCECTYNVDILHITADYHKTVYRSIVVNTSDVNAGTAREHLDVSMINFCILFYNFCYDKHAIHCWYHVREIKAILANTQPFY